MSFEPAKRRVGLSLPWAQLLLVGMIVIAVRRIADTYPVFNHTMDEPAHIGGGMQYLDHGSSSYEFKHPPMRAVFAVGPWLLGHRYGGSPDSYSEGHQILYGGDDYVRTLTSARVAALPFFAATVILVFLWARALSGSLTGIFAALAYSTLPLSLAHAGLATNDTLVAATFTVALLAWSGFLARQTRMRAVLFGIAAALAFLSKMSAVSFIVVVVITTTIVWFIRARRSAGPVVSESRQPSLRRVSAGALVAATVSVIVVWAVYRFSIDPLSNLVPIHTAIDQSIPAGGLRTMAGRLADTPIPAPEFAAGFLRLLRHNSL